MNSLRCLVVDDEELARALLENYIARMPQLERVASCANPLEALQVLGQQSIDLIFLDIQMPELTGVEFLRSLQEKPGVIFTTAYPDYAIEGYQLDVSDYLLKPFSFERFVQAVNKAAEWLRLREAAAGEAAKDYLLVHSEHKIHKLRFDDLLYIQSMREYVAYYTPNGRILSLQSLKKLEETLPAHRFVRIHKSYIVAVDKVTTLEGNQLYVGNEKLPIGASYKEQVLRMIF